VTAGAFVIDAMPVIRDRRDFDHHSGGLCERIIFNHRRWILAFCAIATLVLGVMASRLTVNASFEAMMPQSHPYIRNYFANQKDLRGLGNSIRVVVENTRGDIFDPTYLATLAKINDALFLLPGVDRPWMKSLWTPSVRWTEITEEGFRGGPVMPDSYDGSPQSIEQLRVNLRRTGLVGRLVANDYRSSMIVVPLLEKIPDGERLDYAAFSHSLDDKLRSLQTEGIRIHVVGFARLMGEMIDGLWQVAGFFAVAVVLAVAVLFVYSRCWRSTMVLVATALLGVVWLLGLMRLAGFVLHPYSVLVPFLIFSIGLSHGAQKMNGIMQDIGRGTDRYVAARYTFRRLFLTGLTALLTNVVGFAVLMIIDVPMIRDLALATSLGVGILIFTKLVLVPVLLSYVGVSAAAAQRSVREQGAHGKRGLAALLERLVHLTERRWAAITLAGAAALLALGLAMNQRLQIGDLDPGAPELRADSRYNRDNDFITRHYALSGDAFGVIVRTGKEGCDKYRTLVEIDRLDWSLRQVPGVQTVVSLAGQVRLSTAGSFEGNPKWMTISSNQNITNAAVPAVISISPEFANFDCTVTPVIAYLADHKADTLARVLAATERFAAEHGNQDLRFLPAAGSAGIEAVTNIVVRDANGMMLAILYGAVILLCMITFRNWRAVVVAVVPLVITSVLCEALMVALGIGIKVATLPVIALGIGVGVDYALYLLSVQLAAQRAGVPLTEAYRRALRFTGKMVALIGVTLSISVAVWAWSPMKFQADMGVLLTFMFLWNMVGALVLIPALSCFLLQNKTVAVTSG
jgi:predicted RND superfamily exporter protein